jgi:SRSO17 transposase
MNPFVGTRYETRATELLASDESIVVENEHGTVVWTLAHASHDVLKLHFFFGDARVLDALPKVRLIVAEFPEEPPYLEMITALLANNFREEGRINDYVADGIALQILVRTGN